MNELHDQAWALGASLAGAGAAVWVAYLRWKDRRRPEPWWWMAGAVVVGALAVGLALLGYRFADTLGRVASWEALTGPWPGAIGVALTIGVVEEGAKLLPVLAIALGSAHFDELWDGPIYAGAAAIGFATAETVALFAAGETAPVETLARALAAPITHVLFAAPWGLGLARWRLEGRPGCFAAGLGASVVLHGAYDLLLARPGFHLAATGVVLALWTWMLWTAHRLGRAAG
jgi:RsiW-degrading membrane proteinase PrsW (M82 family)